MARLDVEKPACSTLRAKAVCLTAAPRDPIRKGMLGHYTLPGSNTAGSTKSESFRFSFVVLSPRRLIEACAEGHDILVKGILHMLLASVS